MSALIGKLRWKALLAGGALLALAVPPFTTTANSATTPKQGIVCTGGAVSGSTRTFDLQTADGYIYTPDGNTVYSWGFSVLGSDFQLPGPVLCANQGETVVVHLTNDLPVPVSIVFPGQEGVQAGVGSGGASTSTAGFLTLEANAKAGVTSGTATYTLSNVQPGTYLYQSGTNQRLQVEMGLYGSMVVRPTTSTGACVSGAASGNSYAYSAARTAFDPCRENILVLAEVDPDIHLAVEQQVNLAQPVDVDLTGRHARYYLINGRAFPDTLYDNGVPWLPNQPYGSLVRVQPIDQTGGRPSMIRYVNAGLDNHPFHPHGNNMLVIGRDGRLLQGAAGEDASFGDFTRTVGAGQTYDLLFEWILKCNTAGLNGQSWLDANGSHSACGPAGTEPNRVQVTIPSYNALTFKDNETHYSGSPYLGQKGTIPSFVTKDNICGEYYFPWHSHALNEFANFDAGFGGMATLVRVDPPPSMNVTGKACK